MRSRQLPFVVELSSPCPGLLRSIVCLVIGQAIAMGTVQAQSGFGPRVDIPQTNLTPINPTVGNSAFGAPSSGGTFANPSPGNSFPNSTPRLRFGQGSVMDPYDLGPGAGSYQPSLPSGGSLYAPGAGQSPGIYGGQSPGVFGPSSTVIPPPSTFNGSDGYGGGAYPPSAYPSGTPSTLFPGGLFSGGLFGGAAGWFGGSNASGFNAFQFLHGPRARYSYILGGNDAKDLSINDIDLSIALAFPNFLYSTQPLYVVPSFSLSLWDGPNSSTGADLPGNVYSGFLDFGWQTDPNQMFGIELGLRVGAFTEFDVFRSESMRVQGKGLASFRLTPATTFKLGVYYLDRNEVKLLPAGGWLWQPNPYTRADIFFPEPKFARYWRTIGTRDVWWYLAGEYGGGSWTIERANGNFDSIDINDLRIKAGWEWGLSNQIRAGRRSAFLEIGYVFDREIIYKRTPGDNLKPGDGIMFGGGIGY